MAVNSFINKDKNFGFPPLRMLLKLLSKRCRNMSGGGLISGYLDNRPPSSSLTDGVWQDGAPEASGLVRGTGEQVLV